MAYFHWATPRCLKKLDVFFGMSSMFSQLGRARPLKACVMDFAHEYKQVGIPSSQLEFATIVSPDLSGTPMVASLRTQPVGSSRAPANWARVANFVQFAFRQLCNVWLGIYAEDCCCVEPADCNQVITARVCPHWTPT